MRPLRTFRPEQEVQGSFADFTGGLDLRRLGVAAVTKHSPAALNIDWQPDGGFCTRRTVRPFSASVLHGEVAHLATYEAQAGITKLVVCYADGSVDTFSGTPKVPTVVLGPVNSPRFMVQANYKAYFLSPDTPSVALDGTFAAPLGGGFNTDRNNRTNANIPQAKLGVVFSGYMWIFDTFEGGTRHRSRARWSFPLLNLGGERDWHPDDYIDINIGEDGEDITAAVVSGNRIIVFKQHKTYEIVTSNETKFAVREVSGTMGAQDQKSVTSSGGKVWAWDSAGGVHVIQDVPNSYGQYVYSEEKADDQISSIITERLVNQDGPVSVISCGDKVMFSVSMKTGPMRTWVFHTSRGHWTVYDLALGASTSYTPKTGNPEWVAVNLNPLFPSRLLALEHDGSVDDFGSGSRSVSFFVETPFITGPDPSAWKLFSCGDVVIEGRGQLSVEVRQDYAFTAAGTSQLSVPYVEGNFILDEVSLSPSEILETNVDDVIAGKPAKPSKDESPALGAMLHQAFVRGSDSFRLPRCHAKAIQIRFSGVASEGELCLRALFLKWRDSGRKC